MDLRGSRRRGEFYDRVRAAAGPLDDGLGRTGLRRLGAAVAAATAAAAAAISRRLGVVHRRIGDWVHAVTLFLGEPGIVTPARRAATVQGRAATRGRRLRVRR